jgi:hypothetical protein
MINLSFSINWPWFKNLDKQTDYIEKTWRLSKHKSLEVQLSKAGDTLIGGAFRWNIRCDHAGVLLDLSLFRHFFIINLYDNRHWNYDKDRYINYDDPEEVKEWS